MRSVNINGLFDPDNAFWGFLQKVYDIMYASLLWFVFSLPLITIGASTTALYGLCFSLQEGREGYITKTFVDLFKKQFLKATVVWLLLLTVLGFLYLDAWFFSSYFKPLFFFVVSLALMVCLIAVFLFPLLASKQDWGIRKVMKHAFILAFSKLAHSITLLALFIAFLFGVYSFYPLVSFTFGFITFLSAILIMPIIKVL